MSSLMAPLTAWLTTAVVFGGLDAIWLSQMTPRLYRPALGDLLAPRLNVGPAVVFYVLYVTGLVVFAVIPALERGGLVRAAICGGVLGLVAYGTYDLTNQATLRNWSLRVTLADMAWGAVASTIAAGAAYMVASRV